MASKKHRPEEAVAELRQVDVLISQGQTVAEAIRAIRADDPVVAAVHQDLCLRYSGRVIAALILAGVDRIRRE